MCIERLPKLIFIFSSKADIFRLQVFLAKGYYSIPHRKVLLLFALLSWGGWGLNKILGDC